LVSSECLNLQAGLFLQVASNLHLGGWNSSREWANEQPLRLQPCFAKVHIRVFLNTTFVSIGVWGCRSFWWGCGVNFCGGDFLWVWAGVGGGAYWGGECTCRSSSKKLSTFFHLVHLKQPFLFFFPSYPQYFLGFFLM
jgi:hypothetical protein